MWQSFGKLFQIPLVVRAVIIDTFVNTEVFTVFDRLEGFPIAETVILVPEFPVLFDEGLDDRQFVREEFLILRAVDFIMGPLFERDVSADKENKPADLAILFLNDSK